MGSAVYNRLLAQGVDLRGAPTKHAEPFQPPKHYQFTSSFKKFPVDASPTLWREKKPTSVPQRREVLQKCGKSCFMMPDRLGFPICNKNPPPCEYNRKGINAAYARSREWKYEKVAAEIENLRKSLKLPGRSKKKD